MKLAGIQFVWGRSQIINAKWRLRLFCAYRRAVSPGTGEAYAVTDGSRDIYPLMFVINVRMLLVWLGVLGVAAYLTGAALFLQIQKKHPHNLISYYDLVWPMRWSHVRELQGKANLASAKDEMFQGRYGEAFMNLRVGLPRHPANTDARLTLAVIYISIHQRAQADRLLMDVFNHGYPGMDFVTKAADLLKAGDNTDGLLRFCELAQASLAGQPSPDLWDDRIIHRIHIEKLMDQGRYDEALALTEKFSRRIEFLIAEIKTRRALAQNDPVAAEPWLMEWLKLAPKSKSAVTSLIRTRRMAGRLPEMQAAIDRLHDLAPLDPGYVTTGLKEYWLAGADKQAAALLDAGVLRYASNPEPLYAWAEAAADAGRDAVADHIEKIASEHGFDLQKLLVAKLCGQIRRRQWEQALATENRLAGMAATMDPAIATLHKTTQALIAICTHPQNTGDGGTLVLVDALSRQRASLSFYKLVVEALLDQKRVGSALNVLAAAKGEFPASSYIDAKTAETNALKLQLDQIQTTAPAVSTKTDARPAFRGPADLLAFLDKQSADGQPEAALGVIRHLRASPPSWFGPAVDEKLAWREILFSAQGNDLPLLQLNLRTYLRNQPARIPEVLTQAKSWFEHGHESIAILAANEILRLQPNNKPTLDAMAVWSPPPKAANQPSASHPSDAD